MLRYDRKRGYGRTRDSALAKKRARGFEAFCSGRTRCTFLQSRSDSGRNLAYKVLQEFGYAGASAEIGVWKGANSVQLLKRWHSGGKHTLVDPYASFAAACSKNLAKGGDKQCRHNQSTFDTVFRTARDKLKGGFPGRTRFIRDYSVAAARQVPDASLSFLYIDARHDYEGVLEDLRAWWPKLCPGGLIGGHDWTEALPGTARRDYRLKGMNDKMHPVAEVVQKFLLTLDDAAQERDIFVTAEHPPSWFFSAASNDAKRAALERAHSCNRMLLYVGSPAPAGRGGGRSLPRPMWALRGASCACPRP